MMKNLKYCFVHTLLVLILSISNLSYAKTTSYNVLNFGAKPNGLKDSTEAFENAWAMACGSSGASMIYVPKGRYLLGALVFGGNCKSYDITFRIDGTLVAPTDYQVLGKVQNWLSFEGVSGVSIIGGALDAKGDSLWACKSTSKNCPNGATTLRFTNSKNIRVMGLLSLNSQMFHISFNGCKDVQVHGIKVIAAGNSPNTDGIHVQQSENVQIFNSLIKTGDDCISIGPATKNLWIERVACGPGHGISIGSLAKDFEEEGVQNVTVKTTVFTGSTNGLRIKSWARHSKGFVQGVRFIDALMHNVQNPIIIDQNYCPHNLNCPSETSGVQISDVVYKDIRGTSATKIAMKFDCSPTKPCKGIRLENIKLTHQNDIPIQSFCTNAIGEAFGLVQPIHCF